MTEGEAALAAVRAIQAEDRLRTVLMIFICIGLFASPCLGIRSERSGAKIKRQAFAIWTLLLVAAPIAASLIASANGFGGMTSMAIFATLVPTTYFYGRIMARRARDAAIAKNFCYLIAFPGGGLAPVLALLFAPSKMPGLRVRLRTADEI